MSYPSCPEDSALESKYGIRFRHSRANLAFSANFAIAGRFRTRPPAPPRSGTRLQGAPRELETVAGLLDMRLVVRSGGQLYISSVTGKREPNGGA